MTKLPMFFGVSLLAACLEPPDETTEPQPEPTSVEGTDDGQLLVTEEGAFGRVRVTTPDGPMLLSYQVVGGRAIHELDVDLGPVRDLLKRGGAARLGYRWPNGLIRYAFDESFVGLVCGANMTNCVNVRDRIRATLDEMETKLPLRFVEVDEDTLGGSSCFTNPTPACDGIVFRYVSGLDQAGKSSHTGMEGGVQYISFRPGHEGDDYPPQILYNRQPTAGTTRHEVLHGAGLWHEQSRNDRNEFVQMNWGCIIGGSGNGNYEIKDESADLGPYDFASIMHYGTNAQCIETPWTTDEDGTCACDTMTPLVSGATISSSDASDRGGFSIEDTNTVYRMYAKAPGSSSNGDNFGKAVARGDFDHDGYDDLAVGIPGEDLVSGLYPNFVTHSNAGMVSVWKGTPHGLVAWITLTQQSFSGEAITTNAQFGAALAAGDFNADGSADLAIGAPGIGSNAGAVFVFKGSQARTLVEHRRIVQSTNGIDDNEANDRFGSALAAGNLTGLVRADACGPNFPIDALVVGAPGDSVGVLFGTPSKRGSVFIYQETTPSCSNSSSLNNPTVVMHSSFFHVGGATGDDFGAALAVGDLDGDGRADLAIGAPNFNGGQGKVFIYQGVVPTPVENPFAWSSMVTETDQATQSLTMKFGSSLAIGKIVPFGRQLIVGAPGGNGKVVVLTANGAPTVSIVQTLTDTTGEAGDEFGASVAIGDVDRNSTSLDLVVGVPGEDNDAGAVVVFRGGTAGLPTRTQILQTNMIGGDRDAGDRFGAALAIGSFNGLDNRPSTASTGNERPDLVVTAPGEKPELSLISEDTATGGAFDLYRGGLGLVTAFTHHHQENAGRASDP